MSESRAVRVLPLAAAAVLVLAGCDGDDPAADPPDGDDVVEVTGTDGLMWEPESLSAEAGEIEVALTCEDAVNHDLEIEETGDDVVECAPGETQTGTVELDPGEYTYVCMVPGHEATMRGTLTVG